MADKNINITNSDSIMTLKANVPFARRAGASLVQGGLNCISLFLAYHFFVLSMQEYIVPFIKNTTFSPYLFWGILLMVGFVQLFITNSRDKDLRFGIATCLFKIEGVKFIDFSTDKDPANQKLVPIEALTAERFDIWLVYNKIMLRTRIKRWVSVIKIFLILLLMSSCHISFYVCKYLGWL